MNLVGMNLVNLFTQRLECATASDFGLLATGVIALLWYYNRTAR